MVHQELARTWFCQSIFRFMFEASPHSKENMKHIWFSLVHVWILLARPLWGGSFVSFLCLSLKHRHTAQKHMKHTKMCGAARLTFEFFLREAGCVALLVHFRFMMKHRRTLEQTLRNCVVQPSSRLNFSFEELVALILTWRRSELSLARACFGARTQSEWSCG